MSLFSFNPSRALARSLGAVLVTVPALLLALAAPATLLSPFSRPVARHHSHWRPWHRGADHL